MIYFTLFLHGFLAATLLPFASEATFTYALVNGYSISLSWLIVSIGNSLGSIFTYYLGVFLPHEHPFLKRLGVGGKYWKKAMKWTEKHGAKAGFFCWVPIIGDPLALALGYLKSPQAKTIVLISFGKFIRFAIWGWLIMKGVELF